MPEQSNIHQLSRGTHRLTREEVLSSQRGRLLAAMGESAAELGYARTSVAEVIKRAGVSRETFYQQFSDKEDCFLAALDAGTAAMLATIAGALEDPVSDPLQRLDLTLRTYLDALASEPAFAKSFLIETYSAGPDAIERRFAIQQRFVDAVGDIIGARRANERFACEMLVAGISSIVTSHVARGHVADLRKLRRPIMTFARESAVGHLLEETPDQGAERRSS